MKVCDLDYLEYKRFIQAPKIRKFKKVCSQILVVFLCVNVFICVFFNENISFLFTKQIYASYAPSSENFGKLKFVDSKNYVTANLDDGVNYLVYPFESCFVQDDLFVSCGNNLLKSVISGKIISVVSSCFESKIKIESNNLCVEYVGKFIVGVNIFENVKINQNIAFCENGYCKLNVYINEEIYKNFDIFA